MKTSSQVVFSANKVLKEQIMKKLKREGATLTSFLQYAMRAYVEGRISLGIIPHEPQWNPQLEEEYQATIAKKGGASPSLNHPTHFYSAECRV